MEINKYYVAGILETKGCFVVQKTYDTFRMPVSKNQPNKIRVMDKVFQHLKDKHDISYHKYTLNKIVSFDVIKKADLKRLINFINKYCLTKKKWQVHIERRIK